MNKQKVTVLFLTLSLALGLTACGAQNDTLTVNEPAQDETTQNEPAQGETTQDEPVQDGITQSEPVQDETTRDEPVSGGWTANRGDLSLDANPDVKAAFEKATEGLTGYTYEPIAYLGSQAVAGMNYRILCRSAAVVPDAAPVYQIVTVYQNLEGNAEISGSVTLPGLPEEVEGLPGGWTVNAADFTPDGNPDVKAAFETATGNLLGVGYEPVAYLASQVVAGMNYKMFCRTTPVIPNAEPFFTVVTVYAHLDGGSELLDVTNVDF